MKKLIAIASAVMTFSLLGCSLETEPPSTKPEVTASDPLALTVQTPDHVEGTYTHDHVSVQFVAEQSANSSHFALRDALGKQVVDLTQDSTALTLSVLGRASQRIEASTLKAIRDADESTQVSWTGITMEGDPQELDNLKQDPSYGQLPYLSLALGAKGITGKSYPATLQLHIFASRAAVELHVSPHADPGLAPQPPTSTETAPGVHAEGFSVPIPHATCTYPNNMACCTTYVAATKSFTGPVKCTPNPTSTACPYPPYPDLRCDPNHDGCFGMCGPGCDNCWDSVCGDCQYHWQCAQHDWVCREYEQTSSWNPLKYTYLAACYSVNALISAVACAPDAIIAGY